MSKLMKIREAINSKCRKRKEGKEREDNYHRISKLECSNIELAMRD